MKNFRRESECRPKTRKRSSTQFATIFGRKFVGSFSPGWLFFLWSSSAQLSMGERLNLDGGTRPPYNLSTGLYRLQLCLTLSQFDALHVDVVRACERGIQGVHRTRVQGGAERVEVVASSFGQNFFLPCPSSIPDFGQKIGPNLSEDLFFCSADQI